MTHRVAGALIVVCALAGAAEAGKPIERRLHSNEIEASSFLWNDWNKFVENYHPNYVGDDDPTTAWVEGAPGSGAGQWIRLHVTPLAKTTHVRLHVRDGYQKTKSLFTANARAKGVTLRLLPSKVEVTATFADQDGWQDIEIDQPSGSLTAVELRIGSVYEGTKYEDMCISDLQVFATSETPDNPALEKSKQKALLDWRASRIAASKLFAGKVDLPLAPSYEASKEDAITLANTWTTDIHETGVAITQDPGFAREWKDSLAVAAAALAELDKLPHAQLAPAKQVALPEVDGVQLMTFQDVYGAEGAGMIGSTSMHMPMLGTVASLFVDQLRVLDVKGTETPTAWGASKRKCDPDHTPVWVKRMPSGDGTGPMVVRALVVASCGRIETREGHYDLRGLELLVYGPEGRLALVVGPGHADGYRWVDEGGRLMIAGAHVLTVQSAPSTVEVKARTTPAPR